MSARWTDHTEPVGRIVDMTRDANGLNATMQLNDTAPLPEVEWIPDGRGWTGTEIAFGLLTLAMLFGSSVWLIAGAR